MVRIIRVSKPNALKEAVKALNSGKLIVFPTETSYGMGADATNKQAVKHVFEAKKMQHSKKISVMVSDKAMVHRFFGQDKKVDALIDAFLPGPLTIVTKGNSFRIPDYPFCRHLAKSLGRPITSTSSNIAGQADNYSIKPILKQLHGIDLFIDGGRLPKRKTSTVYDVDKDTIYREGPISAKRIRAVIANMH